ncbi:hypothetical protein NM688_g6108 [Phlebia brevispora]|uniref:Uncharacterized protein n=1 Tax=Phlebia brevispora TaxID=194682 RepID=A0ACC1SJY4_9APHY|nr:hypothetical protein NM688_g6108 [Phlebia brevispora]
MSAPNENEELEREIFGSDSELSEQESDVPSDERGHKYGSPGAESESSAGSDEYVREKRAQKQKQRKRPQGEASGEGRAVQKKRKRKPQLVEQDLSQLPPEQASRLRVDMQIEAILKPKKNSRPKKKKKDAEEDVLDRAADEEVSRLRESMLAAAADDEQANREKMPATAKLRLLPQVMETLRKTALSQAITDNNLLEGVGKWLEPLPDKSLPALDIQREFFPILKKMEFIDTSVLKESGLGKVILFYTKCKRVSPDIARMANNLISAWSRPIIKRSASYRDRAIRTVDVHGAEAGSERLNAILARAKEQDKNRVRRNAVAIPVREMGSYTVAPAPNAGIMRHNVSVDVDIDRRKRNAERLRSLTRKISTRS